MTITMKFGSSRIEDLQAQTSKDEFKNNYEQLLLTNMSSNYHNTQRYTKMVISMISWANGFTYTIENESEKSETYTWYDNPKLEITKTQINNEPKDKTEIELIPYQIWCKINNQTWVITEIETRSKNKTHCLQINTNNCKLEQINCSKLYPNQ